MPGNFPIIHANFQDWLSLDQAGSHDHPSTNHCNQKDKIFYSARLEPERVELVHSNHKNTWDTPPDPPQKTSRGMARQNQRTLDWLKTAELRRNNNSEFLAAHADEKLFIEFLCFYTILIFPLKASTVWELKWCPSEERWADLLTSLVTPSTFALPEEIPWIFFEK